jgi:hypothetical protein
LRPSVRKSLGARSKRGEGGNEPSSKQEVSSCRKLFRRKTRPNQPRSRRSAVRAASRVHVRRVAAAHHAVAGGDPRTHSRLDGCTPRLRDPGCRASAVRAHRSAPPADRSRRRRRRAAGDGARNPARRVPRRPGALGVLVCPDSAPRHRRLLQVAATRRRVPRRRPAGCRRGARRCGQCLSVQFASSWSPTAGVRRGAPSSRRRRAGARSRRRGSRDLGSTARSAGAVRPHREGPAAVETRVLAA